MSLSLLDYNGRKLTEAEIKLLKHFENREREKKEAREVQRKQHLQMSQAVNFIDESVREDEPHIKHTEKTVKIEQSRHNKSQEQAPQPPSLKRLRPDADSSLSTPPQHKRPPHEAIDEAGEFAAAENESVLGSAAVPTHSIKTSRFKLRKDTAYLGDIAENELDPNTFPAMGLLQTNDWNPFDEKDAPRTYLLDEFSVLKNQTLAFKITVPSASREFAINIGPEEMITSPPEASARPEFAPPHGWKEVLLHFNPRYSTKKKEIMLSDMQEWMWGLSDRRPFASFNVLPIDNFTLIIQIRTDGFYMSVNGTFLAFFKHRRDISDCRRLALQLALSDDYGNHGNAIFHKVWWGRRDAKSNADFAGISDAAKESDVDEDLARSLFVGGLPRDADSEESAAEMRDFLWEVFADYGVENVNLISSKGYAFVMLPTAQAAREAILACNGLVVEADDENPTEHKLVVSHARSKGGITMGNMAGLGGVG